MTGKPFANENVMEDYMSALLIDDVDTEDLQKQAIARLLDTARPIPKIVDLATVTDLEKNDIKVIASVVEKNIVESAKNNSEKSAIPDAEFQALFFEIAGLILAVPLTELGGIHQIDTINPLFGKPSWFKGVMLHKNDKYNVVDTAKWIMPEKSVEKLAESTNYQYLILLDDSGWGLGCERLVNTATLQPDDVKWRNADASRPWLAGMVKNKMCALVNVKQLVTMLNQGLSSK